MSSNNNRNVTEEEELPPYNFEGETEEAEEKSTTTEGQKEANQKKGYVAIHSSGFRDFLLKPELLRAVVSCGFEHPSEVQHECIPQAILGMDVICQAKSGMGKTAVFVLAVLQQLEPVKDQVQCVVLGHTRELAYQIANEFTRFSKFVPDVKTAVFYGGIGLNVNKKLLETEIPNIVVGTPGRVLQLAKSKLLDLSKVRHFVVDECDKVLQSIEMRAQVQEIFMKTPHDKQVMMFSATLNKEMRVIAKKFMHNPMEIYVDDESKLTLHGLQQYYVKVNEQQKNKKLMDLLDNLEFNQVVIFVRSVKRANELSKLLEESMFPSICVHSDLTQEDRILRYKNFKDFKHRILVSTDIFGRGIDIQRVNIVINYDMPDGADTYLHRVGRAGRFGTKGLGISFVNPESKQEIEKEQAAKSSNSRSTYVRISDDDVLEDIQKRFTVKIKEMPAQIDVATYMSTQ